MFDIKSRKEMRVVEIKDNAKKIKEATDLWVLLQEELIEIEKYEERVIGGETK